MAGGAVYQHVKGQMGHETEGMGRRGRDKIQRPGLLRERYLKRRPN